MTRTRARALLLVNWKGVFYERYLIDRHVTALEGANGAGKTTVMIAAYVALLPDMSRLRFTNLGETGATGGDKGIWGRLGEPGRPAYSAIDFALASGHRLLIGIGGHLTMPPLPHHRAYGSVPRRFDRIRPRRGCRVWGGRASRNGGCVGPAGPPHVRPCASTPSASQRRWRLGPLRVPGGGVP